MQKIALTIPEAVQVSGISRSTLYEIFKTGKLNPRKQGTRTLVLADELKSFVENLPTYNEVS